MSEPHEHDRRPGCLVCDQEDADPSVTVFRDPRWAAGIVPGFEVPGWIVLRLRRHAETIGSLDARELALFGRRSADLVGAVREVTGAAATYLLIFGEAYPHFHALVSPRTADVPPERRTGDILKLRSEIGNLAAARELIPAIRRAYDKRAAASTDATARQDILALEERRTAAMVAGDLATLRALIDDECRYVHSSGATDTKESYLAKLAAGAFSYEWIRSSEQVLVPMGDGSVLVAHRMEAELVLAGVARPYRSQATAGWRDTESGPRLVFFQATTLPTT